MAWDVAAYCASSRFNCLTCDMPAWRHGHGSAGIKKIVQSGGACGAMNARAEGGGRTPRRRSGAGAIVALLAQQPHAAFEPFDGQREHAVIHDLPDHGDRLPVLPQAFRLGVET